jgi:hypothetical protein
MRIFRNLEMIERVGADKGGYWRVIKKEKK